MKQFDSSIVGQPYSRVMFIGIRYTAPMTAVVNVNLQQQHHPATCGTGQCSSQAHGLCLTTS